MLRAHISEARRGRVAPDESRIRTSHSIMESAMRHSENLVCFSLGGWRQRLALRTLAFLLLFTSLTQAVAAEIPLSAPGKAAAQIRSGQTAEERTATAERLYEEIRRDHGKDITDSDIAVLISLLDSPDDSVRHWIAMSLGAIGPRAAVAAPKLLSLLPAADCLEVSFGSSAGIRYALKQMKVQVPAYPNCSKNVGSSQSARAR